MRLDPQTTVDRLLKAIPSCVIVFDKLGIKAKGNETKSLQQVCTDHGIGLEEFLRQFEQIDWEKEVPEERGSVHFLNGTLIEDAE